jgi:hypothetical protein
MKKFMEELANAKAYLSDMPGENSEAARKFRELRDTYRKHVGRRALFKSGRGEARVVTIEEVTEHFVRVSYSYYGRSYSGRINTCSNYNSLVCGDDRLEIER